MKKENKNSKSLKLNKLKFLKDARIKHEIIAGACSRQGSCFTGVSNF